MRQKSLKINAVLNVIKQCCTVIFPLITFPYVSRVLGVMAYGKYNFSTSFVAYFSLLAGLGVYSYAVRTGSKIRDNLEEFSKFANEVFSINIISTLFAYVLLAIVLVLSNVLNPYRTLIVILSISIFLTTIGTDWINAIYEDFLYITIRYIICQTLSVVLILLLVNDSNDLNLYAFLSVLGTLLSNISNIIYIRRKLNLNIKFTFKINFKVHFKPIIILFGNMVSSMVYLYADNTMLGLIIGDIAVGYYSVASKIYTIVKQLLNAISNAVLPRLSYNINNNKELRINELFNKLIGVLILFLFPAISGMICVGKNIIIVLSGINYVESYYALCILSVSLLFSTLACVYVSVFMLALGQEKQILISTTLSAIVNIFLNLILIPKYSYNAAAFTTLISEFLMLIMGIFYTKKYLKLNIKKQFFISIFGAIIVFAVCNLCRIYINNPILYLVISIIISLIVYGLLLLVTFLKKSNNVK